MSTEGIDRRLHRLHDGDLSSEEREALSKEIAALPVLEQAELTKKLEGLREIGVVVRAARTDDVPIDGDAVWKSIEAKIAADAAPARPALRAIEGGAKTAATTSEDPRARRRRFIGVSVGAFAIAAAAMLMIYDARREGQTVADATPTAPPATAIDEAPTPPDYTEVLAVDFGRNVGTIFSVEGEAGQRYAVVWLDDVLKQADESTDLQGAAADLPVTPD